MFVRRPGNGQVLVVVAPILYVMTSIATIMYFHNKYEMWAAKELSKNEYQDTSLRPARVLLQPDVSYCLNISILVVVHTRLTDSTTRNIWRKTYGSEKLTLKHNYKLVFAVGTNAKFKYVLKEEHRRHGDILQVENVDSYRNLTLKHLSVLHYFTSACQHPTMLLKMDDDVVWRVDEVSRAASRAALATARGNFSSPFISCCVRTGDKVQRNPTDKWFVPPSVYGLAEYPRYCLGLAYLASHSATTAMTKWAKTAKFFWIDDMFITGNLRLLAEVGLENMKKHYNLNKTNETSWDNDLLAFQLVEIPDFEKHFNRTLQKIAGHPNV